MPHYDFEPSAVCHYIAKVSDEPTRTALAIVAAMVYQSQQPAASVTSAVAFFNSCNVNDGNVILPMRP